MKRIVLIAVLAVVMVALGMGKVEAGFMQISAVSPNPAYIGDQVLISGTGFGAYSPVVRVVLYGQDGKTNYYFHNEFNSEKWKDNLIQFVLPVGAKAQSYTLTVDKGGGLLGVTNYSGFVISTKSPTSVGLISFTARSEGGWWFDFLFK